MLPKLVDDSVKLALQLHPLGKSDASVEVKSFVENNEIKNL
jgi:hypothetical protein